MSDMKTIYKIRLKSTDLYSCGRVEQGYMSDMKTIYKVTWKVRGKEWTSEKLLKKHLLTCIEKGVDMSGWEIMEFMQQPSKSLNDWCDAQMTFAMLKHKQ